jgi:hypothetical protein
LGPLVEEAGRVHTTIVDLSKYAGPSAIFL